VEDGADAAATVEAAIKNELALVPGKFLEVNTFEIKAANAINV
jgi:hypothetical protein